MATTPITIDATINVKPVNSAWESFTATISGFWSDTVVSAASKTVNVVDGGVGVVLDGYVGFMQRHENLAIASSPATVQRLLSIQAFERKYGSKATASAVNAAVTTQQ